jgi:hypothetical protein
MNRKVKDLLNSLASTYSVVSNPDHPLLLRGPDALVSDYGYLAAVFTLSSRALRNPNSLLVRLAISRYALPQTTRSVLLAEQAGNQDMDLLRDNFHAVLVGEEHRDLERIIRYRETGLGRSGEIPQQLRARYLSQYWVALEQSRRAFAREPSSPQWIQRGGEEPHDAPRAFRVPSWGLGGRATVSKKLFTTHDGQSLIAELPSRRGAWRAAAEKVIEYRTRGLYKLDRGVMHGNDPSGPSLLLSRNVDATSWDPRKLRRAAAFGGWTLVPGNETPTLLPYEREYTEVKVTVSERRTDAEEEGEIDDWESDEDAL